MPAATESDVVFVVGQYAGHAGDSHSRWAIASGSDSGLIRDVPFKTRNDVVHRTLQNTRVDRLAHPEDRLPSIELTQ
jgi:hypothetical protein